MGLKPVNLKRAREVRLDFCLMSRGHSTARARAVGLNAIYPRFTRLPRWRRAERLADRAIARFDPSPLRPA